LWEAWSYLQPALSTVVYPAPEIDAPPLPPLQRDHGEATGTVAGGDEFSGVRPYRAGDPRRMIAWRLAARSDDLSVKFFESSGGGEVVLDLEATPARMNVEQRIERLARWVLVAEAGGIAFSLRLPGTQVPQGRGPDHVTRCLEALALFDAPGRDPGRTDR
jgi:uncharacterized protein (DUF58 family)